MVNEKYEYFSEYLKLKSDPKVGLVGRTLCRQFGKVLEKSKEQKGLI